jgi:hypothetical protein
MRLALEFKGILRYAQDDKAKQKVPRLRGCAAPLGMTHRELRSLNAGTEARVHTGRGIAPRQKKSLK